MPSGSLLLFVILWTSDFAPLKGMFCNTRWLLNVCRCPPCDLRVQATVWLLWTSFWCQTLTRYRRCFYTASIGPVVSCFQRVEEMFSVQNQLCVKKCRVISWHLQDAVGSWAKTKVSSCSVDFAQRNLTDSLKTCTSTKIVEQILQFIHTQLHKFVVLTVATCLSPATDHDHVHSLLQLSSQYNRMLVKINHI